MNATCTPPSRASAGLGVTESLVKPRYSVTGDAENYEVRVELPGVRKDAIKIDLEDNVLTLRGERSTSTPDGWKPLHRELSTQSYLLRLRLNTPVNEDQLTAHLDQGVLTLRLPVKETAKPRRIEVQ